MAAGRRPRRGVGAHSWRGGTFPCVLRPPNRTVAADLPDGLVAGRATELRAAFDAVVGKPGSVVIRGSAGAGKTHLAHGLANVLQVNSTPVEWVTATTAAAGIAFGAF